jgi:hypothetical protein
MKSKRLMRVFTVSLFSFLIFGQVESAGFPDSSRFKPLEIIKVEKIKRYPILKTLFSRDFQKRAESLVQGPIVYIENSRLADCYREQPLLFGFLTLFITISLGVLAFVFHLIRDDPRFY